MLQNQCNSGGRFFSSLVKIEVVSKAEVVEVNKSNHSMPCDTYWSLFRYTAMGFQALLMKGGGRRTLTHPRSECGNS